MTPATGDKALSLAGLRTDCWHVVAERKIGDAWEWHVPAKQFKAGRDEGHYLSVLRRHQFADGPYEWVLAKLPARRGRR